MVYNLSLINGTGLTPLISTINDNLMFGWYGNLGLITLFCLFFMAYMVRSNNTLKSLTYAALITAVSSSLFRIVSFVNDITVLICWILAALLIAYSFMESN